MNNIKLETQKVLSEQLASKLIAVSGKYYPEGVLKVNSTSTVADAFSAVYHPSNQEYAPLVLRVTGGELTGIGRRFGEETDPKIKAFKQAFETALARSKQKVKENTATNHTNSTIKHSPFEFQAAEGVVLSGKLKTNLIKVLRTYDNAGKISVVPVSSRLFAIRFEASNGNDYYIEFDGDYVTAIKTSPNYYKHLDSVIGDMNKIREIQGLPKLRVDFTGFNGLQLPKSAEFIQEYKETPNVIIRTGRTVSDTYGHTIYQMELTIKTNKGVHRHLVKSEQENQLISKLLEAVGLPKWIYGISINAYTRLDTFIYHILRRQ